MTVDHGRLQRLVDKGAIDDLLALVSLDQIADTWWLYQRSGSETSDDPHWWAVELWMTDEFLARDELRRAGLLALIERADSDEELRLVGAGPLEEFVADEESRLAWVERQAAESASFRAALGNVWCWNGLSPESFVRLEAAARTSLARGSGSPTPAQIEVLVDAIAAGDADPRRRTRLRAFFTEWFRRRPESKS